MESDTLKVGDHVMIAPEGVYYTGKPISPIIKTKTWIISSISNDRVVLGPSTDNFYMGSPVAAKYLTKTFD